MKLEQFFDQWIYRSGHPELEIEFSLTNEHKKLKIKIAQKQVPQDYNSFSFPLEIRIVYVDEEQSHTVQIVQKEQEETVEIVQDREIKYISIDPYFKVLRKIKTINVSEETDKFTIRGLLENQLKDGKTIIEKIDAARALRDRYSKDVIKSLQEKVLDDRFYGVSAAAADTLGSYNDKKDYDKTNTAYEALKSCLKRTSFVKLPHQVRLAVVINIGSFEKDDTETVGLLEQIVNNGDQSYLVEQAAAHAIGKCAKNISDGLRREEIIKMLMNVADADRDSFQNVVSQGAINGLREFWRDSKNQIIIDIAKYLKEKTETQVPHFKRIARYFCLREIHS